MTASGTDSASGAPIEGAWQIATGKDAEVRLKGGRVGPMTIDVTAPVSGGELTVTPGGVDLTLQLALDQLRTGNFFMQAAARSLVGRNDARVLTYIGKGESATRTWHVEGHAIAATIDVVLQLSITPCGPDDDPMREVSLEGNADVGTVNLPLPGLGKVDDFAFDVEARLALQPRP